MRITAIAICIVMMVFSACKKDTDENNNPPANCNVNKTFEIVLIDYNNSSYASTTYTGSVTAKFTYVCCASGGSQCPPPVVIGTYNLPTINPPLSSTSVPTSPCYYSFTSNSITVPIPVGSTYNIEIYDGTTLITSSLNNTENNVTSGCGTCCSMPYKFCVMR